jgi:16S rRNA U1498 N3-methylase RsmE
MRLHRFYIKEKITHKKEVRVFDESILHQMKSVFRLEAGHRVALFDGSGKVRGCDFE